MWSAGGGGGGDNVGGRGGGGGGVARVGGGGDGGVGAAERAPGPLAPVHIDRRRITAVYCSAPGRRAGRRGAPVDVTGCGGVKARQSVMLNPSRAAHRAHARPLARKAENRGSATGGGGQGGRVPPFLRVRGIIPPIFRKIVGQIR